MIWTKRWLSRIQDTLHPQPALLDEYGTVRLGRSQVLRLGRLLNIAVHTRGNCLRDWRFGGYGVPFLHPGRLSCRTSE
jgi:hypothetical protein